MAAWQENIQAFDLLHQVFPNTGHQITDANINNLISQLATLRRTAEIGFSRMEQTLSKLDKYDEDLKADLLSIKTELATSIEPSITMGAKMDNLTNRANDIDNKFANAEQKLLIIDNENKLKYDALNKILEKHATGIQNIKTSSGGGETKSRSLLESKAIQSIKNFDGNRANYKG